MRPCCVCSSTQQNCKQCICVRNKLACTNCKRGSQCQNPNRKENRNNIYNVNKEARRKKGYKYVTHGDTKTVLARFTKQIMHKLITVTSMKAKITSQVTFEMSRVTVIVSFDVFLWHYMKMKTNIRKSER